MFHPVRRKRKVKRKGKRRKNTKKRVGGIQIVGLTLTPSTPVTSKRNMRLIGTCIYTAHMLTHVNSYTTALLYSVFMILLLLLSVVYVCASMQAPGCSISK